MSVLLLSVNERIWTCVRVEKKEKHAWECVIEHEFHLNRSFAIFWAILKSESFRTVLCCHLTEIDTEEEEEEEEEVWAL